MATNSNNSDGTSLKNPFILYDLTGFWLADYGSHGLEVLEIVRKDSLLIAKKITGDVHVPAGEVSFYVDTKKNGEGKIQIAEKDFKNQEWTSGKIAEVIDNDTFVFQWGEREVVKRKFTRIQIERSNDDLSRAFQSHYGDNSGINTYVSFC